MAQTVQLKRSATEGAQPNTSDLSLGELAINTYDGKVFIKKSVGGTESVVEVGKTSNQFTTYQHTIFSNAGGTLSNGQTSFSGSDDNGDSLSYTAGNIIVALNGVVLDPHDFTASNGTAVVLAAAVKTSDVLEVISLGKASGSALTSVVVYEYEATANQTGFSGADHNSATLSYDLGEELVFVNGILFDPRVGKDYTRTNTTTITMNSGLQAEDVVVIYVYGGGNPFKRYQFDLTSGSTTQVTGTDANGVTLSFHPDYTEVYANGVLMQKGQWTGGDGKTITFTDAFVDPNYVIDIIDYKIDAPKVRLFRDSSPFLGGNLNVGTYSITSSSGQDIKFQPSSGQAVQIDDAHLQLDILASDPSTEADKVAIYAKDVSASAEMFVRDEAGNVTQISPHNSNGEWIYYSENTITGKRFKVNMEKMIRKLQQITGETFIEIDE
tara:strand:- start:68428 stop:69744 length:1317 start_codon:yes stop_codon:yes gene_type:complete